MNPTYTALTEAEWKAIKDTFHILLRQRDRRYADENTGTSAINKGVIAMENIKRRIGNFE